MATVPLALTGAVQQLPGYTGLRHVVGVAADSGTSKLTNSVGAHNYWCWGAASCPQKPNSLIGTELNLDTIAMTWITIAIVLGMALFLRSRLTSDAPRGTQNVFEFVLDFVNSLVRDILGSDRIPSFGPLAVSLFVYILFANYLGLIPLATVFDWWHSPTSDINTTLGLSLMVFIMVEYFVVRTQGGGGFFTRFLQPYPILAPFTVIEEVSKPVTLTFRLFGNIFAGEFMVLVFGSLLTGIAIVGLPIAQALFGLGLGLFTGAVQAFIFTILTIVYIGMATTAEGH